MRLVSNIVLLFIVVCTLGLCKSRPNLSSSRHFSIKQNRFVEIDEQGNATPFQIIAAEVHYARILPQYWRDRLERIKSLGVNAVQVCVW